MSEDHPASWDPRAPLWTGRPCLNPGTLDSLAALNEEALELIAEEAARDPPTVPPLLRELQAPLRALDAAARQRAARCPYLLLDAGFASGARWSREERERQVHDGNAGVPAPFFTVQRAPRVLRLVLTFGWHLARSERTAARLLLGMSEGCAERLGACTLPQVEALAQAQLHWLRPRWPEYPRAWQELLAAACAAEPARLERAVMRGVQRLAAEARAQRELL